MVPIKISLGINEAVLESLTVSYFLHKMLTRGVYDLNSWVYDSSVSFYPQFSLVDSPILSYLSTMQHKGVSNTKWIRPHIVIFQMKSFANSRIFNGGEVEFADTFVVNNTTWYSILLKIILTNELFWRSESPRSDLKLLEEKEVRLKYWLIYVTIGDWRNVLVISF